MDTSLTRDSQERLPVPLDGLPKPEYWEPLVRQAAPVDPGRTSEDSASVWLIRLRHEGVALIKPDGHFDDDGVEHAVHVMTASGLALADQIAFARGARLFALRPAVPLARIVTVMEQVLHCVAEIPLRDAMGWALTHMSWALDNGESVWNDLDGTVDPWTEEALGTDALEQSGWVYAAAGLTPTEALAGLADGSLTEEAALGMAALRGATLPA